MQNNNTGKYLKYAIGEIVLVVIGILIALQINNWNERRKSNAKTQDYYAQLLDDLHSDKDLAEQTISEFNQSLTAYNAYIELYRLEGLQPGEAYSALSELDMITRPFTFNTSTIEALQNSGDIGLIPAPIRNKLINLVRHQQHILRRNQLVADGKSGIIQELAPLLGSTTLPSRLENQPKLKAFLDIESNLRKLILIHEGIQRWKNVIETETIDQLQIMQTEIDELVELIKSEMP